MSNNYYEKGWGLKTHRRLKNVIIIMEFCPSKSMLTEVNEGKSFSVAQEKILSRAFATSDGKMAERIKVSELKEVLRAVDVIGDDEKEKEKFLSNMNLDPNGTVSFDELKQVLSRKIQNKVQTGRYYVALSLAEAQCMRLAIHGQHKTPFLPGTDAIVALRTERTMLDSTVGFEDAQTYQHTAAQASYRFIDSAVNFAPKEVNVLLRVLQEEQPDERSKFFMEVRSNRRRKQIDPNATPLKKVFSVQDEHNVLQYRIAVGRITALLKSRGMYARDAFAAFDQNRDGMLSGSELQAGLNWLGLKLDTMLLRHFMLELDKDKDGYINLDEFKEAVGWEQTDADAANAVQFNGVPLPPPPKEVGHKHKLAIPAPVLAGIKVKVKRVGKFSNVWTSQGSMSRVKGSVWEPADHKNAMRSNRAYVYLGHYSGTGFDNPNKDRAVRLALEITDTTGSWVGGSSWLPFVLDRFLPRPARYRLVWSITTGANPFYAWEPVPPSDDFVALGCIGTKTDKPPDVRMMRCVCKHWCTESKIVKSIWNDSGSGGREGSIWLFNSLNLIGFVNGHDPPRRKPFDLKAHRFFLREYSCIKTNGIAPAPTTAR
jgi:Ca2+-binding EF-hand superfamily protein